MQKYGSSSSRVYCVFAKSTNSNSWIALLFKSRMANFPKTLLLVS